MYWLTGVAGLFFVLAPYLFNYMDNQPAMWTSVIAGLIVLGVSLWEGLRADKERWEYWVAGLVGVFAITAPFVLNFGAHAVAMWTSMVTGAVIAVLAGSKLWVGGGQKA
ncbi:MAG: SPW repeat protein [Candidatus Levyibacteriota bacterium]